MEKFMVDLNTFLGLAMSNQSCHKLNVKLVFGWYFGARTRTLMIPIYIVLLYYMI